MPNWNLFWTAFGAIGTSLGSIITAVAVVIAVKQYLQPIKKKIAVRHGTAFPVTDLGVGNDTYEYIEVVNKGLRDIYITGFYIKIKGGKLYLNSIQLNIDEYITFPYLLKPEEKCTFYMDRNILNSELYKLFKTNKIHRFSRIKYFISDTAGNNHYDKKRIEVTKYF